jgi:hypothetical protein
VTHALCTLLRTRSNPSPSFGAISAPPRSVSPRLPPCRSPLVESSTCRANLGDKLLPDKACSDRHSLSRPSPNPLRLCCPHLSLSLASLSGNGRAHCARQDQTGLFSTALSTPTYLNPGLLSTTLPPVDSVSFSLVSHHLPCFPPPSATGDRRPHTLICVVHRSWRFPSMR